MIAVVEKKLYAEDALALPKEGLNVTTAIGEDLKIFSKCVFFVHCANSSCLLNQHVSPIVLLSLRFCAMCALETIALPASLKFVIQGM